MTTFASTLQRPTQSPRRETNLRVLREVESLCATFAPGQKLPTHTEIMRSLNAPERAVMNALQELQRRGRIVRRHGSGTYITDQPSVAIAHSRNGSTKTIVAIVRPDAAFFDLCVEMLCSRAAALKLDLSCQFVGPHRDVSDLMDLATNPDAGYLLFHRDMLPCAQRFADAGLKTVLVGSPAVGTVSTVPCVHGNHEEGGYIGARHLIDLGHRRIALAHFPDNYRELHRWLGYCRALNEAREAGIAITDTVIVEATIKDWLTSPAAAEAYFRAPNAPTGLVAWNDHEAGYVLRALSQTAIRVPRDVSLIGYDCLPEGALAMPSLTTVDHSMQQQIDYAIRLLTQPDAAPRNYTVVALPQLVRRASTAPPRQD